MVEVEEPLAVIEAGAAEINEVVGSAACAVGVKVAVGVLVGTGEADGVDEGLGVGDAVAVEVGVGLFVIEGIPTPE